MLEIYYTNHGMIENQPLKGPTAVICIADSQEQLARIHEQTDVKKRLDLVFHDTTVPMPNILSPSDIHAARILEFVQEVEAEDIPSLCVQCQCGLVDLRESWRHCNGSEARTIKKSGIAEHITGKSISVFWRWLAWKLRENH